jgi:dTDP-4-dehydrorhamnose 3,5-epimerase
MTFKEGLIQGVEIRPLVKYKDERGWLGEIWRQDELDKNLWPVMSYVSLTHKGIVRGPHEHKKQTDIFLFLDNYHFCLYLWDNRSGSKTYEYKYKMVLEETVLIIVPPGVVHAYKNIGEENGLIINFPDRLYKGQGKKEAVDEIRYENETKSPYRLW